MREKEKFPRVDYCYSRASVRRSHTAPRAVLKITSVSQSNVPSTTLDVGRRFVLTVFKDYQRRAVYV
jgi:hypothetical protein